LLRSLSGLKPVRLGPLGPVRPEYLAGGAAALIVVIVAATIGVLHVVGGSAPSAKIVAGNLQAVKLEEPITVKFSRPVDLSRAKATVTPSVKVTTTRHGAQQLIVAPFANWAPKQTYTLRLSDIPDASHSTVLKGYHASFTTQPLVGVLGFTVDGQPANGTVTSNTSPLITARFVAPMKVATVQFLLNNQALPASTIAWDTNQRVASITLPSRLIPYHQAVLQVPKSGSDKQGNPMTDAAQLTFSPMGLEPSNGNGIGAGFKTIAPIMIVVENAPGSLPSHGLQHADMVFEYLSEYGITRMTAVFFNQVSPELRSVRSCRMINAYLDFALTGYHLCSGASDGTYLWLMGNHHTPVAPGAINDVDRHGYFFRCGTDAPHNLCVTAQSVLPIRRNWPLTGQTYLVDPAHPDNGLGAPAGAPSVGQHCVSYRYDGGSQTYLRFDHGSAYIDAQTGQQLHVKNVVLMTVGEHYGGWVEDENGGAGSVWYEMIGTGPAQIYSDGKLINATWHMGDNLNIAGNNYWQNNQAPYFTDSDGHLVELNSGLTWIHVIGNRGLNAGC
jgi:DUF3048 family protein/Big-like domain-containing protein